MAWVLVAGCGSVLLATLVMPSLRFAGAWPDIVTLMVLWHALHGDPKGRYVPGMAVGLMRDLLTACPFGAHTVLYGLMHRVVGERRYALRRDNPIAQLVLAFVAVLVVNLMMHLILVLTGAGIGWSAALSHSAMIAALSAPFMPLVCLGMRVLLTFVKTARRAGDNWAV